MPDALLLRLPLFSGYGDGDHVIQGSSPWTGGITLDADGNTGVTVSVDGKAEVWDLRRNERLQMLRCTRQIQLSFPPSLSQ
jgi:hypothetical protein